MRLVFWNANMGMHNKLPVLLGLRPDVAVIPECADEATLAGKIPLFKPASMAWVGRSGKKGLAVFGFGHYTVALDPCFDAEIRWIAPVHVRGPHSFRLLAVWACHNQLLAEPRRTDAGPLLRALDRYAGFLADGPLVVGGDFNNSVIWDEPGKANNHANAVHRLGQLGLFSAYHHNRGAAQGAEPEPTLYWRDRKKDGPRFHIDYCFLPTAWQAGLRRVEVGGFDDWVGRKNSDHVPMIVDVAPNGEQPPPGSTMNCKQLQAKPMETKHV